MTLYWPDNISTDIFLKDYWQKKPLLIRNGFSNKIDFISPDELAGLACEEEIESRIITGDHKSKNWTLTHGPFEEDYFSGLPESAWTLLVQDVDKHLPEAAAFLRHFDFIPKWRIDDLMISTAEDQGSDGPQTDSYDVFLVQLQGERLWKLSDQQVTDDDLLEDCEVRVLKEFETSHEWLMKPGDVLYLPPGIPHWGIAQGECMTGSVGFISPTQHNLLHSWTDYIVDNSGEDHHYRDPALTTAENPYNISSSTIDHVSHMLKVLSNCDRSEVTRWFGELVSESKPHLEIQPNPNPIKRISEIPVTSQNDTWIRHPYLRIFYAHPDNESIMLFANGESFRFPVSEAAFVHTLCEQTKYPAGNFEFWRNNMDCMKCLVTLSNHGYILIY